jgi:glycosyltransferase involved in cell wall biosynthesis
MRIGILPQGGNDWIAGVIYVENLVRALNLLPDEERPLLCFVVGPDNRMDDYRGLGNLMPPLKFYGFRSKQALKSKLNSAIKLGLRNAVKGDLRTQWPKSLEQLTKLNNLSALFPVQRSLGREFPSAWIGWIPDFQHRHMPHFFSNDDLRFRDELFNELTQEAAQVVVSSEAAYRDLTRWFPTSNTVSVFSFVSVTAPEWYQGNPDQVIARFKLPRKYLICPSQFWIHKNHRNLFDAIRIAKEAVPDITLVCTGTMQDYRHPNYGQELLEKLARDGLTERVHCLGLLDRYTQIQLLRGAAAVVQPSLFEGWSSLLEDARAFAKRVYVSDIPVHREQDPPDSQFFNPHVPEELAALFVKDWRSLTPGPEINREERALLIQKSRAIDFARRFLRIVDRRTQPC